MMAIQVEVDEQKEPWLQSLWRAEMVAPIPIRQSRNQQEAPFRGPAVCRRSDYEQRSEGDKDCWAMTRWLKLVIALCLRILESTR
jgi:hypothetical protein